MSPTAGFHRSRGDLIDIGGRRLRAVVAGPVGAGPMLVLECGAFGCAADWAVVQARLAALGHRSIAYDRAGLGYSDRGPRPRDGSAIAADLEALLDRLGVTGPIVAVGHSMAGLLLRVFVARNRDRVRGVVLVDAVTPETGESRTALQAIESYRRAMGVVGRLSGLGFMRPVSLLIGDMIGLEGEARTEKRRIYGMASHARWASEEVSAWHDTAAQGVAAGPYDPRLPVAVVTAGRTRVPPAVRAIHVRPAEASAAGYQEHVSGAGHASLLGVRYADTIVAGILHVLREAG